MINNVIKVIWCVHNDASIPPFETEIRRNDSIEEFKKAAEIQLNLNDSQAYKLILERNGRYLKVLKYYKTFEDENIQQNDKLVYFPFNNLPDSVFFPEEKLVTYTLTVKVPVTSSYPQYSININAVCENNPKTHYFANPEINSRLKFEKFIREKVKNDISKEQIDKIIESWCKDIRQGFQTTTLVM